MLATEWAGTSLALGVALSIILVWVVTGPLFGFSDTWQLVINTAPAESEASASST
jgi:low affinity Fe/Cu permease